MIAKLGWNQPLDFFECRVRLVLQLPMMMHFTEGQMKTDASD